MEIKTKLQIAINLGRNQTKLVHRRCFNSLDKLLNDCRYQYRYENLIKEPLRNLIDLYLHNEQSLNQRHDIITISSPKQTHEDAKSVARLWIIYDALSLCRWWNKFPTKGKRGLMRKGRNQIYFNERIFLMLQNFPELRSRFESIQSHPAVISGNLYFRNNKISLALLSLRAPPQLINFRNTKKRSWYKIFDVQGISTQLHRRKILFRNFIIAKILEYFFLSAKLKRMLKNLFN